MKFGWKYKTGALALSVAMLSMSATAQVAAKGKSSVIKPPINLAPATPKNKCHGPGCHMQDGSAVSESTENKSGTIPVENDIANPATERGHLCDPHPSCKKVVSERAAAPPPTDDAAAPPSAERKFNDQWSGATSATDVVKPPVRGSVGSGPTQKARKSRSIRK
jgi:hypothetical protein